MSGHACWRKCSPSLSRPGTWTGSRPSTPRSSAYTSTAPPSRERDDQIAHRRKKPGRPIDFGETQRVRYRDRNVVERCFNKLKQWRGIAMRSDKLARNYRAGICLAAALIWIKTDLINTP